MRRFVGIELKPDYADIAAKRLQWQKEKTGTEPMTFQVLKPSGQLDFYVRLLAVRGRYLSEALKKTVDDPAVSV